MHSMRVLRSLGCLVNFSPVLLLLCVSLLVSLREHLRRLLWRGIWQANLVYSLQPLWSTLFAVLLLKVRARRERLR